MYSYSPKKLILVVAAVVLIGFVVVQGVNLQADLLRHGAYTTQQSQVSVIWGDNESNPSSPVRIRLGISNPPALGKTGELVVVISSAMDATDVEAHVKLSDGFATTSGTPDWKGNLIAGQKVELRYTIKSVKVGDWVIEGTVKWSFAEGSFYTDTDKILISVSGTSADVTTTAPHTETIVVPPANETIPGLPGNTTMTLPLQESGQLVMLVSPTLVAVGIETTITITYGLSSANTGNGAPPAVTVSGGAPSFEGAVIITYGPVLAESGGEWVATIKPTAVGVIRVVGQDNSGTVHVYAEITVVESLPPPVGQPPMGMQEPELQDGRGLGARGDCPPISLSRLLA